MTKIRIRILESSPLTERWERNYALKDLTKVFDIEYWDCSAIVKPSFDPQYVLERDYIVTVESLDEFKKKINTLSSDTIIVCNIHANPNNFRFYKSFTSKFHHIVFIDFITRNDSGAKHNRLKTFLYKFYPPHTIEILYWKIYRRLFNRIVFSCSPTCTDYRINDPDYEAYITLSEDGKDSDKKEKYILYIDNYFPFHPEIKKREPKFNPNAVAPAFYESMNNFFSMLEKKYNCSVIIAAHPSAVYTKNPFGGRKIIFYKTNELVRDAFAIVMHTSNSLTYVCLNRKPVALVHNKAYREAGGGMSRLKDLADLNGLPLIDTDKCDENSKIFTTISEQRRQFYVNMFTDGKSESNASRFIRYFKDVYRKIYG